MSSDLSRRLKRLEQQRPDDTSPITRIERVVVDVGPHGPVPTGEVIVRHVQVAKQ